MVFALVAILKTLMAIHNVVLAIGRQIAWMALALMVLVILMQVVFRYVFNNALPWPDEAARFLMLWMAALTAPSAMRWGGFVAIDMLPRALPMRLGLILGLFLLLLSAVVLYYGIKLGWNHTMGFGGSFNSSSLKIPLDWFGGESVRLKLRYMYGSLLFAVMVLFTVNIELIIRTIIGILNPDLELPRDKTQMLAGAD